MSRTIKNSPLEIRPRLYVSQPDVPTNCSVLNQTSQSVVVRCTPGFDGGQPQSFLLEVLEAANGHQLFNMTQLRPHFVVDGLAAGQLLQLRISAVNAKGRSDSVTLDAATLMPPEMRASGVPLSLDLPTAVGALLGLVSALLLLAVAAVAWLLHPAAAAAELSDKDDRNPDVVPSYCDDWSETDAASSSRGTPVVPAPELPRDGERPPHPAPAWEVFKVCPAACDAYVPHPATLRRPPATRLQQAGVRPEVTYAELRLPPLQAGPPMRRYYRHEPVVYAQIAHAPPPAATSVATVTSEAGGACAMRAASPQQLEVLQQQQPQESREVVTVRTPLMVGQQESCV
ncbi:uncharacterized protein LOC124796109 [Schistocerca piceifrons]|uniref:uncharacterized protein LOC124796109 n=1 Tax=Schistocerca piceifrons TaxID=274613 RepID=UPI001F5E4D1C|nr:uncharacterized protein LOC124796109 [Schistocerca piceifrons]